MLHLGDCLDVMPILEAGSVDMVLADLPYGTTACKWDSVIPFEPLWREYRRVCKPTAAIVLTASQPFTSALVMSNPTMFRYDWVWRKARGRGHLNARKQPLRDKEDVLVFYSSPPVYKPQMQIGTPYKDKAGKTPFEGLSGGVDRRVGNDNAGMRYPRQVLEISGVSERDTVHPTQKPVALMEYFIRTYTNPGDTILDNAMGSGTTGVACLNTGRKFIGIERDRTYFEIAQKRVQPAPQGVFFTAAE